MGNILNIIDAYHYATSHPKWWNNNNWSLIPIISDRTLNIYFIYIYHMMIPPGIEPTSVYALIHSISVVYPTDIKYFGNQNPRL